MTASDKSIVNLHHPLLAACLISFTSLAHCGSTGGAPSPLGDRDAAAAGGPGSGNGAEGGSSGGVSSGSGSGSRAGSGTGSGNSGSASGSASNASGSGKGGNSGTGTTGSSASSGGPSSGTGSGNLGGNGCAGGTCLNPTCTPWPAGTKGAAIETYPGTGFDVQPAFIPNDVIIPTLDDVPDGAVSPPTQAKGAGGWAAMNLSYLDANKMHWDLFINTSNDWTANSCDNWGASMNAACVAGAMDILKLHNPGNHTAHHWHLGTAPANTVPAGKGCGDAACVTGELLGVESIVSAVSKGARPHLTRFRAPFGEPYEVGAGAPGYDLVAAVVARYAVSVGWNLDSTDSLYDDGTNCTALNGNAPVATCPTGQDIAHAVEVLIGTPGTGTNYGIVLMHGIFPWTRDAIPLLFDPATGYLAKNKFRVGTVEDAICWKYGMHSWDVINALNHLKGTPQELGPN